MIKRTFIQFTVLTTFLCANHLSAWSSETTKTTLLAQGSGSMGSSTTQGGSTIQQMAPLEPLKQNSGQTLKPKVPTLPATPTKVQVAVPVTTTYLHPGILVFHEGRWQGSDHLLNVPNDIGVYVTIIKPDNTNLNVTDEQVKKVVADVFNQVGIKAQTLAVPGEPPLPAFEIQLLAYPIEKGFTVSIDGRLFESVEPKRFHLDEGMAFQAVTWEKKTLQVGPINKIDMQILKSVQDIAIEFADRYKAYDEIRKSSIR